MQTLINGIDFNETLIDNNQNIPLPSNIPLSPNSVYQDDRDNSNLPELGGDSYEEAYKDLDNDETNFWPNDAYRDFLQLIAHYHISDNIANAFIHFFNQHGNMKVSPLPRSMHKAKKLIKSTFVPYIDFQKVSISIVPDQECFLYYRSIKNAIKSLLSIASINENLVLEYKENYQNGEKIYEEQFNANWWKREELALPKGQRLLSIILYSDATSLDNLGKSSGHPVFISLGNIPNWQ
jgi:hypothetical protein